MVGVLIDTSSLIDLALGFDERNQKRPYGRLMYSMDEAIEAFILYDAVRVDGPSYHGFADGLRTTRYFREYAADTTRQRLQELSTFFDPVEVSDGEVVEIYSEAVNFLDQSLDPCTDTYDEGSLYHRLPYHLGDDTSDMESGLIGIPSSDLEHILEDVTPELADQLKRFVSVLNRKGHPSRSAWAVPLIRLLYYQNLQWRHQLHFVPHPTKATIAQSQQMDDYLGKSIINYFDKTVRADFEKRKQDILGTSEFNIPLPLVADFVLHGVRDWSQLVDRIHKVRNSRECTHYRDTIKELTALLEQRNNAAVDKVMVELESAAEAWKDSLTPKMKKKSVRITIPIVGISFELEVPYRRFPRGTAGGLLVFIHKLLGSGDLR
jgi:hypothetical protein